MRIAFSMPTVDRSPSVPITLQMKNRQHSAPCRLEQMAAEVALVSGSRQAVLGILLDATLPAARRGRPAFRAVWVNEAMNWAYNVIRLTALSALDELARHSVDFWLTTEDLPLPQNRVTVDRDGIHISYSQTNAEPHRRLTEQLRNLLGHIGCGHHLIPREAYFSKFLPVAATGHQNGTIRFGSDPTISALNLNCQSHDVDNLYVVDSSFFPSCSAVNPTLTIIANAIRVADHLRQRLHTVDRTAAPASDPHD